MTGPAVGYLSPDAAAFTAPGDDHAKQVRLALGQLDAVDEAIDFELVSAFPAAEMDAFFPLVVSEGGEVPYERMHAPVVDGRYPDRNAPREVALSERTATRLGVEV